MLTVPDNERISHVGPGTPMGNLLQRYWQPIAAAANVECGEVLRPHPR